ncbi:hypothetical protein FRB99_002617 [Tulasnella sp. 403]|nr:hypothetical protein FRB99_002617 [Tulasnella sp. 403]
MSKLRGPYSIPENLAEICDVPLDYPERTDEALAWLKGHIRDLDLSEEKDDITLAERGLPPSMSPEERRWRRQRELDLTCWTLGKLLRRKKAIQLEDGVEAMHFVMTTPQVGSDGQKIPPKVVSGEHNEEIINLLETVDWDLPLDHGNYIGPGNIILCLSTLARAYRRNGDVSKAEEADDKLMAWVLANPLRLSPGMVMANLLGRNEKPEDSPVAKKLRPRYFSLYNEHPYIRGKGWVVDVAQGTSGTVLRCYISAKPLSLDLQMPVELVPPREVDKKGVYPAAMARELYLTQPEKHLSSQGLQSWSGQDDKPFTSIQYKFACATIRTLKKNRNAEPFLVPVDPIALGIPHYPTIIDKPMDFATIERKLFATVPGQTPGPDDGSSSAGRYWSVGEWVADVRQVFQNSYIFNGEQHPVSKMAATLEAAFEKQLKRLPSHDEGLSQLMIPPSESTPSAPASVTTPDEEAYREKSQTATPSLQTNTLLPAFTGKANDTSATELLTEQLRFCHKVLDHLHKKEYSQFAWFFYNPVDEADLPGYHAIIERPMSLAVMRDKLSKSQYSDASAFRADFEQIVWNCNKFNPVGSVAQACAKQLKDVFEKKWRGLPKMVKTGKVTKPTKPPQGEVSINDRGSSPAPTPNRMSAPLPTPTQEPATPVLPPPPSLPLVSRNPTQLLPSALPPAPSNPLSLPQPATKASATPVQADATSSLPIPRKRKNESDLMNGTSVERDVDVFDRRLHHRIVRTIYKLRGSDLQRAIDMIKNGVGNTPPCQNQSGDTEFEVAALPSTLILSLYNTFVKPTDRASKRPKRAVVETVSDSD